jgi:hypothetical protein
VKQGRIEKPSWLAVLYSTLVHTEPIFPRWYHSPLGVLNNVDELEVSVFETIAYRFAESNKAEARKSVKMICSALII